MFRVKGILYIVRQFVVCHVLSSMMLEVVVDWTARHRSNKHCTGTIEFSTEYCFACIRQTRMKALSARIHQFKDGDRCMREVLLLSMRSLRVLNTVVAHRIYVNERDVAQEQYRSLLCICTRACLFILPVVSGRVAMGLEAGRSQQMSPRERDSGPWHADKKCRVNSTCAPSKRSAVPMLAPKLCFIFSVVHACDLIIDHVVSAPSDTCGY